ncbi:alpha/beta hydrolase [Lacibacter sediminis]|uniref:Alpha/beta hydrolase n=1 Tax=Lacibacter sediminis TaxID=2760713 RepID=A0A7G5XDI1_9BACT|nr:alpha/beta hydrolase [Lacibacter sediminis]QNA43534.1 alpha/beta hydrolase [Lacibacter sediminis]
MASKTFSWKKFFIRIFIVLFTLAVIVFAAFKLSPWPSAMIIRNAFNRGGVTTNDALEKHVPKNITAILDEVYDAADKDAKLDVYYPSSLAANELLPVIVWIHGGGLISGDKAHIRNYCKILASYGYVTVSIDYSVAPEKKYPTPLKQTAAALAYLQKQANRFHIDTAHFILAGDSGGAHIASQTANIIYNSSYAKLIGIMPSLNPSQLAGQLLYCGPYDIDNVNTEGAFGGFMQTVLWAYSGSKNHKENELFKTASIINYIEAGYPPSFISAGNGDPLLSHSKALAEKLVTINAKVDTLFFPQDLQPALPHEYQFNLDTEAGKTALQQSLRFLNSLQMKFTL